MPPMCILASQPKEVLNTPYWDPTPVARGERKKEKERKKKKERKRKRNEKTKIARRKKGGHLSSTSEIPLWR